MLEFLTQAIQYQNEPAQKFARQSLDSRRPAAMLREAEPHLVVVPDQLDTHAHLLNFQNCTVGLRTGVAQPQRREDYITKLIHHRYNPSANCPTYMNFLYRIMGGHPDEPEAEMERAERMVVYQQKAKRLFTHWIDKRKGSDVCVR